MKLLLIAACLFVATGCGAEPEFDDTAPARSAQSTDRTAPDDAPDSESQPAPRLPSDGEAPVDGPTQATDLEPSRTPVLDPAWQPLCGLFRGGLDEATNMIASPNPPYSVEDSDAACITYCDASGAQAGDVCVRGGVVIEFYQDEDVPAELDERR